MNTNVPVLVRRVAFGWAAFAGTHMFLDIHSIREHLITRMGEKNFQKLHGSVACVTFVPLIYFWYRGRGAGVPLHSLNKERWANITGTVLRGTALAFAIQTLQTPSFVSAFSKDRADTLPSLRMIPASAAGIKPPQNPGPTSSSWWPFGSKKDPAPEPMVAIQIPDEERHFPVHGVIRITRHPTFTAFFLWGLAGALTRPHPAEFIFWAGLSAFSLIGAVHQDMRMWNLRPRSMMEQTSLLPFGAIIAGKQTIQSALDEMNIGGVIWGLPIIWMLGRIPAMSRRVAQTARSRYSQFKLDRNDWRNDPFKYTRK
eukprot:TRINITY_DN2010_c0_g1_i2.p1 TRINITY_DN2010_c0_g1~~TRINITY_DN2010_c0_g1_i2.p1  ORF type:complete len:313 (-),score=21.10 TRINITY_DN2010_c0_g1_i2:184-1122(-)